MPALRCKSASNEEGNEDSRDLFSRKFPLSGAARRGGVRKVLPRLRGKGVERTIVLSSTGQGFNKTVGTQHEAGRSVEWPEGSAEGVLAGRLSVGLCFNLWMWVCSMGVWWE